MLKQVRRRGVDGGPLPRTHDDRTWSRTVIVPLTSIRPGQSNFFNKCKALTPCLKDRE